MICIIFIENVICEGVGGMWGNSGSCTLFSKQMDDVPVQARRICIVLPLVQAVGVKNCVSLIKACCKVLLSGGRIIIALFFGLYIYAKANSIVCKQLKRTKQLNVHTKKKEKARWRFHLGFYKL